jgi:hypothetical protein
MANQGRVTIFWIFEIGMLTLSCATRSPLLGTNLFAGCRTRENNSVEPERTLYRAKEL